MHYETAMRSPSKCSLPCLLWLLVLLSISTAGCIRPPVRLQRPELDLAPWVERSARSAASGSEYSYMHLAGPGEDAPVLLLLHGGIFDNRVWYYCHGLAKRFTVYAPQFPDRSLLYSGRAEDWGAVVADFVKAAEIAPDYIVAVSNGAYGAIDYLTRAEQPKAKGLVLISAVMYGISDEEIRKRTRLANLALSFAPGTLLGIVEKRALKADYGQAPGPLSQESIFYTRPYPYYYQLFSAPRNQGRLKQDTMAIKVPVLVLHGTEDEIMPIHAARLTPSVFPNGTFVEMKGLGHDLVFSAGPAVVEQILKHLPEKTQ